MSIFRKANVFFLAFALAIGLFWPLNSTSAQTQNAETVFQSSTAGIPTDRIIIKYRDTYNGFIAPQQDGQMERLSATAAVPMQYERAMSGNAHVLQLAGRYPLEEVQRMSDRLMSLPEVEYAEPDRVIQPTLVPPNDPQFGNQWNYFEAWGINMPSAWYLTQGLNNVVVAVVDTGVTAHADLAGRTVPGYDFISNVWIANDGNGRDNDPSDPGDWIAANDCYPNSPAQNSSWHGTHVAGIIGAASNNGMGVSGVNWNSMILPVRVMGKCGGLTSDIVDGLRWAAGLPVTGAPANLNPAKVINLSLGARGTCNATWQNAINEVTNAGAVIVVAAGNFNDDAGKYSPASCDNVITVGATNRDGNRAAYSNYGTVVDISAPGGDGLGGILSLANTGDQGPVADNYEYKRGTSMAAPQVSGIVSLMFSVNPRLTPAQAMQFIKNSAKTLPTISACVSANCGPGIVNAEMAILASLPDLIVTSYAMIPAHPNPGDTVSLSITIKNNSLVDINTPFFTDIFINPTVIPNNCLVPGDYYFVTYSLAAGASATSSISYVSGASPSQTIYIATDSKCGVAESDNGYNDLNLVTLMTASP